MASATPPEAKEAERMSSTVKCGHCLASDPAPIDPAEAAGSAQNAHFLSDFPAWDPIPIVSGIEHNAGKPWSVAWRGVFFRTESRGHDEHPPTDADLHTLSNHH
jgi:hypothetical protein